MKSLGEKVILVFADGTRFEWNTRSLRHARKVLKLQKKLGDPVGIIGKGKVAQTLREKYAIYHKDPDNYKPDVFGTAAKLGGVGKTQIQEKFKKISKKLGVKAE